MQFLLYVSPWLRFKWFLDYLDFAINSNGFSVAGIVIFIFAIIYSVIDIATKGMMAKKLDSLTPREIEGFEKKSAIVPIILFSLSAILRIIGFIIAIMEGNEDAYFFIIGDIIMFSIVCPIIIYIIRKERKIKEQNAFIDDLFKDK